MIFWAIFVLQANKKGKAIFTHQQDKLFMHIGMESKNFRGYLN